MRDLPENTDTDPKRDEQLERDPAEEQTPRIDPRVEEAIRRQRRAMGFT